MQRASYGRRLRANPESRRDYEHQGRNSAAVTSVTQPDEEIGHLVRGRLAKSLVSRHHIMTDREQLIRQIEATFRSVERGAGLTLQEAARFESNDESLLRIPAAKANTP